MRGRDQVLVGLVAMLALWGLGTSGAGAAEPSGRVSSPAAALEVRVGVEWGEGGGAPVLEFAGNLGSFTLGVGASRVFADLAPGAYAIRPVLPAGWRLAGVNCRGGEVEVSEGGARVVVALRDGEPASCTFLAQPLPTQLEALQPRSGGEAVLPLTGAAAPLPWVLAAGIAALLAGPAMLVGGRRAGGAEAGPRIAGARWVSGAADPRRGGGERSETSFESVHPGEGR